MLNKSNLSNLHLVYQNWLHASIVIIPIKSLKLHKQFLLSSSEDFDDNLAKYNEREGNKQHQKENDRTLRRDHVFQFFARLNWTREKVIRKVDDSVFSLRPATAVGFSCLKVGRFRTVTFLYNEPTGLIINKFVIHVHVYNAYILFQSVLPLILIT